MAIDYSSLRKLDLNLLLALNVLIDEANVTKAAEKLNMSQSAMSYSLKRLRTLLGDPILIRSSREMVVTPYAQSIRVAITRILQDIQDSLLEEKMFEPDTSQGDFRIAVNDDIEILWGGSFLDKIAKPAPGIRIQISDLDGKAALDALDDENVDLVVGITQSTRSWHLRQTLYYEALVCVVNKNSDIVEITLDDYLSRRHIAWSLQEQVLQFASHAGLGSQHIVWSTPHVMAIPHLLTGFDCVALLPRRLAVRYAEILGLRMLSPPCDLKDLAVSMIWHQRNDNLARQQWLRAQVLAAAQELE